MKRKPIQIAVGAGYHDERVQVFALCNDGSVMRLDEANATWLRAPEMPQPPAVERPQQKIIVQPIPPMPSGTKIEYKKKGKK